MPSYSAEVLADSPVSYFRLNETSGPDANDQGSANNDGLYVNTPTLGVSGPVHSDPTDKAAGFTASSGECVITPNIAAYAVGDTFSLEAWVRCTGSADRGIVSLGAQA